MGRSSFVGIHPLLICSGLFLHVFVFVDVAIQGEALTTIHMHPQGLVYGRLLDIPNATFMMYMLLLQGCERITLPSLVCILLT